MRRIVLCFIAIMLTVTSAMSADATRPPNFVVILMDDMGWRDVGFMGNTFVETPQIDALARRGLVFSQAYASAPNCAPTRACLMSGQYTPRHGIYTVVDPRQPPGSPWHKLTAAESKSELDTNIVTIAEALQAEHYATSFYGMWNLGRGRTGPVTPGGQGFQKVAFPENLGFGKDEYFDDDGHYLSDRLTDEVLKFVADNRERPFFVYLADHAVHAPYNPKKDLLKKYEEKAAKNNSRRDDPAYAATIEAVDHNVGRIVETLAKLELSDNTYVIFTSDNGGTDRYTAPLNGGKGQLLEGGIRVPLAIVGPGVKKPGSKTDVPVASIDLYPTLLELAGLPAPKEQVLDGFSLVPLLKSEQTLKRERLFWHFPCYVGKSTPASALREGDFKIIEYFENGGFHELYNLKNDPGEERNLAKSMHDKAAAMLKTLHEWQSDTGALKPSGPNPNYDPKAERPRGGQGGNPGGGNAPKGKGGGNKKGKKSAAFHVEPIPPINEADTEEPPVEIGTTVAIQTGFLFVNGKYTPPPYHTKLTATGVEINASALDHFNAMANPKSSTVRFEAITSTLCNDGIVAAFSSLEPLIFRNGYEPLSQLMRHPIPDDLASDLPGPRVSLSSEQKARWSRTVEGFQPSEEFANRASAELSLIEMALRESYASRFAQRTLSFSAYPLTVIAMLGVALAAGHLLGCHPQLFANDLGCRSNETDRAVKKTLGFIALFSALDLIWTVVVSNAGEMHELHPFGSHLIYNPLLLVGFKGVTTAICIGVLLTLRHWPAARKASWHICLICLLLAGRWVTVGGLLL